MYWWCIECAGLIKESIEDIDKWLCLFCSDKEETELAEIEATREPINKRRKRIISYKEESSDLDEQINDEPDANIKVNKINYKWK